MKKYLFILTTFLIVFSSCGRIKNKAEDTVDNVFPKFDAYKADTKHNKKRFKEYLEVDLTQDINEIYCYADFLGIDYKVLFSFNCDSATIKKIVDKKGLKLSESDKDNGFAFIDEFDWWDEQKISTLKPYVEGVEYEYWKYLWYDSENGKAYYLEFSL